MKLQISVNKINHQNDSSHRWGAGINHINISQESHAEREELRGSFLVMDVSDWMIMLK